mmetsp:Transcript_11862/g.39573  ORF Transcript_11862/g.39573 Transcript_11862/m.39573 type:complete len:211 (-) Transcript_11862:58-690(-)
MRRRVRVGEPQRVKGEVDDVAEASRGFDDLSVVGDARGGSFRVGVQPQQPVPDARGPAARRALCNKIQRLRQRDQVAGGGDGGCVKVCVARSGAAVSAINDSACRGEPCGQGASDAVVALERRLQPRGVGVARHVPEQGHGVRGRLFAVSGQRRHAQRQLRDEAGYGSREEGQRRHRLARRVHAHDSLFGVWLDGVGLDGVEEGERDLLR